MKKNFLKKKVMTMMLLLGISVFANANTGDKVDISEPFEGKVIVDGLKAPWAMSYGPDNNLWITERQGKNIAKINPKTGEYTKLYTVENAFIGPQHEGVLGLAFGPDFLKGKNDLYTAYTYKDNNDVEYARIVKLTYNQKQNKLENEKIILDKLPASNDHNSGRLILGPDNKLYYTIGDQGNNQGQIKIKK